MGKSFYIGTTMSDKTAQKLCKSASAISGVSGDSMKAVLCASVFPGASNYAVCTEKEIIYAEKSGIIFKPIRILYRDITGVTTESPSFGRSNVCVTIGGGQSIALDIVASVQDSNELFEYINNMRYSV